MNEDLDAATIRRLFNEQGVDLSDVDDSVLTDLIARCAKLWVAGRLISDALEQIEQSEYLRDLGREMDLMT